MLPNGSLEVLGGSHRKSAAQHLCDQGQKSSCPEGEDPEADLQTL